MPKAVCNTSIAVLRVLYDLMGDVLNIRTTYRKRFPGTGTSLHEYFILIVSARRTIGLQAGRLNNILVFILKSYC